MPGLLEEDTKTIEKTPVAGTSPSKLPKGIVLDKDGKPCRTCTSSAAWKSMMKQSSKYNKSMSAIPFMAALANESQEPNDCPPDVDDLGRATWTLLHSLTATYPTSAPPETQSRMRTFLSLFSQFYPCWVCAEDFQTWMAEPVNEPALKTQEDFGQWMCRAHNAVNVKLGKKEFDCNLWRQRWKDGWDDGRCG